MVLPMISKKDSPESPAAVRDSGKSVKKPSNSSRGSSTVQTTVTSSNQARKRTTAPTTYIGILSRCVDTSGHEHLGQHAASVAHRRYEANEHVGRGQLAGKPGQHQREVDQRLGKAPDRSVDYPQDEAPSSLRVQRWCPAMASRRAHVLSYVHGLSAHRVMPEGASGAFGAARWPAQDLPLAPSPLTIKRLDCTALAAICNPPGIVG